MKKNIMMKIASVLLIAVLLTTCVISGTFAKYTDQTSVSDGARVAKWGWKGSNAITLDLFNETAFGDTGVSGAAAVVAPGTAYTATLSFVPAAEFKPEVAYRVNYDVTATCDAGLEAEMVWTLKAPGADEATTYNDIAALADAIEDITADFEPNVALTQTFQIGWSWAFEEADGDAADTALGNADVLEGCSISITLIVTQLND